MGTDPEFEAFIPLFPQADLSEPATARKGLAELAAAPPDTSTVEVTDRRVPGEADVPIRIQWAGTFHGSQAILSAEISQRQIAEVGQVLRRALAE